MDLDTFYLSVAFDMSVERTHRLLRERPYEEIAGQGELTPVVDPRQGEWESEITLIEKSALELALHSYSLMRLSGSLRDVTADRIGRLRSSDDPGFFLRGWWGGKWPTRYNAGSQLVHRALLGSDKFLKEYLTVRPAGYFTSWESLEMALSSERDIRGLSNEQLAVLAVVTADDVRQLADARPHESLQVIFKILKELEIKPSHIPSPVGDEHDPLWDEVRERRRWWAGNGVLPIDVPLEWTEDDSQ